MVYLKSKPHTVSAYSEEELLRDWLDKLSLLTYSKRTGMGLPDPKVDSNRARYQELIGIWYERFIKPRRIQQAIKESAERMEQSWTR